MKKYAPSTRATLLPRLSLKLKTRQRRVFAGFTLIELLVVIVIIGILATISVAQFNNYQEKARIGRAQAFAAQADTVLMAATTITGNGFPLRLDFDEGTGTISADSSGSANNLSWTSTPNVNWSTDTIDNSVFAVSINATTLSIGNVVNMPEHEIAYSLFFRPTQFPPSQSKPTFVSFVGNNNGFRLYTDGRIEFYINAGTLGMGQSVTSTSREIQLNRWHHILGSYNDGALRLFVDGNLIEQKNNITLDVPFNINGNTGAQETVLNLGYASSDRKFHGDIDRLRVYPVGLDPNNL